MIVADVNLIAYLLIQGPYTADAQAALAKDSRWVAPPIWRHELLNVAAKTLRGGHLTEQQALTVVEMAPQIVVDVAEPQPFGFDPDGNL